MAAFVDNDRESLVSTAATAAAVLIGSAAAISIVRRVSSDNSKANNQGCSPPRAQAPWYSIFVGGSAMEFGMDCRGFLQKYFDKLQTPIFTATIMGKDYHFIDPSYPGFVPEKLFKYKQLTFRPMANDAMQYGFGVDVAILDKINGPDGNSNDLNAVYHTHMMKPDGLKVLVEKAQKRLDQSVFSDPIFYPTTSTKQQQIPLYWLVQNSLFRATIGAVMSESIVENGNEVSALQAFIDHDEKFPLLLSKLPFWLFPKAQKGMDTLRGQCQQLEFFDTNKLSQMIQDRNDVAKTKCDIHSTKDLAMITAILVWASSANTIPTGFWVIYNLLKHKDAYEAIQKEVSDIYSQRGSSSKTLSLEELDQLVKLDSAITETLRLYSESMIARDVTEDFELDLRINNGDDTNKEEHKYIVRKNARIAIMMSSLHMDESVFENATTFQYDRFLPRDGEEKVVFKKNGKVLPTPVRPFGGGVSMCPGRKFARYEIKAYVAELLYKYDLELVPTTETNDDSLKIDPSRAGLGINVPLKDVDVRITRR